MLNNKRKCVIHEINHTKYHPLSTLVEVVHSFFYNFNNLFIDERWVAIWPENLITECIQVMENLEILFYEI